MQCAHVYVCAQCNSVCVCALQIEDTVCKCWLWKLQGEYSDLQSEVAGMAPPNPKGLQWAQGAEGSCEADGDPSCSDFRNNCLVAERRMD